VHSIRRHAEPDVVKNAHTAPPYKALKKLSSFLNLSPGPPFSCVSFFRPLGVTADGRNSRYSQFADRPEFFIQFDPQVANDRNEASAA
jgi:hypothetical protein